jgi:hypothetical protein
VSASNRTARDGAPATATGRKSTDKYGEIIPLIRHAPIAPISRRGAKGCAVPRERRDAPPQAIAIPRRLDAPAVPPLDASETPRERECRLMLARARFVHDERERARERARETGA